MKKYLVLIAFICMMSTKSSGQNGFGLMGGANVSTSSATGTEWRVGGYVGATYDIGVADKFFIQPRLTFSYLENQREVKNTLASPTVKLGNEFRSQWSLTLPVLASYEIELQDNSSLRINAGPYIQYALFGKESKVEGIYGNSSGTIPTGVTRKESWSYDAGDKITYGVQVGVQYAYKHFVGTIDYKHALNRSLMLNMDGFENTIQVGIGYRF